ncbi:hypothetical protein OLMES_0189 [Oleiphilus messinensis]|uniref:DUF4214 domain-containing protein n=1 Tax=Oleiphilus messinensis TaxID=141451 RepID=A0A1Y0I3C3_9GAMM|nr:DUF4214 domain-containing protein [Oleiphilus messinensis]ARU54296.1 hypothetical protein OLMES_0189 [Oleiphilus messinensis]
MNGMCLRDYWSNPLKMMCVVVLFVCVIITQKLWANDCESRQYTESERKVADAYIAYYGRPADFEGLKYWSEILEQEGGDISRIIQAFGNSEEFDAAFGDLSNEELIKNLFRQMFGRDPDDAGLAFYLEELESGRRTLQSITLDVLNGAQNKDLQVVENRFELASFYTNLVEQHAEIEYSSQITDNLLDTVTYSKHHQLTCLALYMYYGLIPSEPYIALLDLEPDNNFYITAPEISPAIVYSGIVGTITYPNDNEDYLLLNTKDSEEPIPVLFRLDTVTSQTVGDLDLEVLDESLNQVGLSQNKNTSLGAEQISIDLLPNSVYYVRVYQFGNIDGRPSIRYDLTIILQE